MKTNQKAGSYNECCYSQCGARATMRFALNEFEKKDGAVMFAHDGWHYRCAEHFGGQLSGPSPGQASEPVPVPAYPDEPPAPPEVDTSLLPDITRRSRRSM